MRGALRLALAGLIACGPVAASAQDTGTRVNRYPKAYESNDIALSDRDRSRQTMLDYARCLIRSNGVRVRAFVADFPETLKYQQRAKQMSTDACIGDGILGFNPGILRASLYTALYIDGFGRAAGPLAGEPIDYRHDAAGQDADAANRYVVMRRFAECVVRADPAAARETVVAPIGSGREDAAYAALAPHLGPCLPQGSNIRFGRTALSGLLAEVLYRLSTTAPSVAGNS